MKISYILCTLGNRLDEIKRLFDSFEIQESKQFEVIIVVQDNYEEVKSVLNKYTFKYKFLESNVKGLSRGRNLAIKYVTGDVIVFSDDDAWYPENSIELIKKYIKNNDIICTKYYDPILKQYPKNYCNKTKYLNRYGILKICSIEIAINLKRVDKNHIIFDENFGVGSKYECSEENIMIMDLKRKNYKVVYVPKVTVFHPCKIKNIIFDENYWRIKGPAFKRIYKNSFEAITILALMTIKKYNRLSNVMTCFNSAIREFRCFKLN